MNRQKETGKTGAATGNLNFPASYCDQSQTRPAEAALDSRQITNRIAKPRRSARAQCYHKEVVIRCQRRIMGSIGGALARAPGRSNKSADPPRLTHATILSRIRRVCALMLEWPPLKERRPDSRCILVACTPALKGVSESAKNHQKSPFRSPCPTQMILWANERASSIVTTRPVKQARQSCNVPHRQILSMTGVASPNTCS